MLTRFLEHFIGEKVDESFFINFRTDHRNLILKNKFKLGFNLERI